MDHKTKTWLLCSAALTIGIAAPAAAQNQPQTQPATTTAAADDQSNDIVVTAQKRSERLIDVPLSISVVSAEVISKRGLVSSEDYLRGLPGVNQGAEQYGQAIVIRGIESSPSFENANSGTTVATYFGETSTSSSGGLAGASNIDIKLVDIERVEVLRGPQGTAFGNASLGGAVRTIPVAPDASAVAGMVGGGVSTTEGTGSTNYQLRGMINIPLVTDKVAVRAVAYDFMDSGFYRERAGSNAAFKAGLASFGIDGQAVDEDHIGEQRVTGGRVALLVQPSDAVKLTATFLRQVTNIDGFGVASTGKFDQATLIVAPEHQRRGQLFGVGDNRINLGNVALNVDTGVGELVATYSHIESGSDWARSVTAELPLPISGRGSGDHKEDSGELRFASDLGGPIDFLVGVYAERLRDDRSVNYIWTGTDAAQNFFGARDLGTSLDDRKLTQKAAFGEVTWKVTPKLSVTGGVRAYDYKRTNALDTSGALFGVSSSTLRQNASGTSFKGNVSYKPNSDSLLYASFSQGFRLGTPQPGLPAGLCDGNGDGIVDGTSISLAQTRSVRSDRVNNYEIGGKFAFADRRGSVSGAVFRIDWNGLPVLSFPPSSNATCRGQTYIANAGTARAQGVELEANFALTDAFRINVGGSYIDSKLRNDASAIGAVRGDRTPGAPVWNGSVGLQHDFAIGDTKGFVRADAVYVGPFYGDFAETANTRSGDYIKGDVTARVSFAKLDLDLFVRNVTNSGGFSFRGVADYGPLYGYRLRPRTIGVQAQYRF